MTRRLALLGLGLLACNVEVGDGNSGLSAGVDEGPGSGATVASGGEVATNTSGDAGETDPSGSESSANTTTNADETGLATDGTTGTATDDGVTTQPGSTGSDDGAPGDPLDPDLDVPEDGQVCTTPGSLGRCPALEVCRFHTTEQGLCESCDVCGNLGAPCVQGTDCDILFACYQGQCTNICPLDTFYCGAIEDCLNVGHPTHGVCAPF